MKFNFLTKLLSKSNLIIGTTSKLLQISNVPYMNFKGFKVFNTKKAFFSLPLANWNNQLIATRFNIPDKLEYEKLFAEYCLISTKNEKTSSDTDKINTMTDRISDYLSYKGLDTKENATRWLKKERKVNLQNEFRRQSSTESMAG